MSTRSQPEGGASRPDASRPYPLAPVRRPRRGTVGAVHARSDAQPRFGVTTWLTLETVADRAGLHPELVRRFAALSLLDTSRDAAGTLWFPSDTPATIARIQRLRAGLCLNYAAIGLVLDLLDRIDALEAALGGSTAPRVRSALEASQEAGNARSGRLWT
ncbi:chaperone modulator CbpM [Parafrankia discariae]|uniref:chaperone modulator CbpM n=1 Tax=Parafrankia discariae TaxID=365528 RepID=UPI0003812A98|nr:chaperone modulator CbpM [Parafrankia discariae]